MLRRPWPKTRLCRKLLPIRTFVDVGQFSAEQADLVASRRHSRRRTARSRPDRPGRARIRGAGTAGQAPTRKPARHGRGRVHAGRRRRRATCRTATSARRLPRRRTRCHHRRKADRSRALPITRGISRSRPRWAARVRMLERNLATPSPPVDRRGPLPAGAARLGDQRRAHQGRAVIGFVLLAILILSELLVRSITGRARHVLAAARRDRRGGASRATCRCRATTSSPPSRAASTDGGRAGARIEELDGERRRVRRPSRGSGRRWSRRTTCSALLGDRDRVGHGGRRRARGGRVVIVDEQSNTLVEHRRLGTAGGPVGGRAAIEDRDRRGRRGPRRADRASRAPERPGAVLAVPLQTTQAVVGLLTRHRSVAGRFGEEDGGTLQALASQGAIAIENARCTA